MEFANAISVLRQVSIIKLVFFALCLDVAIYISLA